MIKNASNEVGRDRKRLNFANTVRESFSFLADYGFEMFDALPTLVRYRKGELEAHVYHGRRSLEVSFEIVLRDERYAISELIRATNPEEAGRYRNYTATTPEGVIKAVSQLKELVKQYGELALQGDAEYFARLEGLRRAWMESYALEVLAGQLRP